MASIKSKLCDGKMSGTYRSRGCKGIVNSAKQHHFGNFQMSDPKTVNYGFPTRSIFFFWIRYFNV